MSQRDVIWNSAKFIRTISVIAATVIPASAPAAADKSGCGRPPWRIVIPMEANFRADLSSAQRSVLLPSAAPSVRANSAGFASAAAVQTDPPEGFSLLAAPTVMLEALTNRLPRTWLRQLPQIASRARPKNSSPVFPLAYRGVLPLKKGSDYRHYRGWQRPDPGDAQARNAGQDFDATQPTVSGGRTGTAAAGMLVPPPPGQIPSLNCRYGSTTGKTVIYRQPLRSGPAQWAIATFANTG